jgi:hypothetical protein
MDIEVGPTRVPGLGCEWPARLMPGRRKIVSCFPTSSPRRIALHPRNSLNSQHQPWHQFSQSVPALRSPLSWYAGLHTHVLLLPGVRSETNWIALLKGRAGVVAWRRSRGGVGALGKAFYKGGFEPRMNKREASLILSLKYVLLIAALA